LRYPEQYAPGSLTVGAFQPRHPSSDQGRFGGMAQCFKVPTPDSLLMNMHMHPGLIHLGDQHVLSLLCARSVLYTAPLSHPIIRPSGDCVFSVKAKRFQLTNAMSIVVRLHVPRCISG
jgi:hypothetical protein